jgi:hypothetical protein
MEAKQLLGKAVQIHLKDGGAFYLKVTGFKTDQLHALYINGVDDEGVELTIDFNDIETIIGG